MAVEEKLIKMGERDDTLPPEYRPSEEDRKVADAFIPLTDLSRIKCCVLVSFV